MEEKEILENLGKIEIRTGRERTIKSYVLRNNVLEDKEKEYVVNKVTLRVKALTLMVAFEISGSDTTSVIIHFPGEKGEVLIFSLLCLKEYPDSESSLNLCQEENSGSEGERKGNIL